MYLRIASINSGSNGNCYYVGNANEAILVDVGISCREIDKRMTRMGLSMQNVKAIFISHEHRDHISGLEGISKKYHLPVYISQKTFSNSYLKMDASLTRWFNHNDEIKIGELTITPFSKIHDGIDPYSFLINHNNFTAGVITDIGIACENVIHAFKQCSACILEANYDEEMLETGRYPYLLKKRIRGGAGHISNKQALELFLQHKNENLSHLILGHLSQENNKPQLVSDLFNEHAGKTEIVVASRYKETEVYEVNGKKEKVAVAVGSGNFSMEKKELAKKVVVDSGDFKQEKKELVKDITQMSLF